jgi:hypothetical protein
MAAPVDFINEDFEWVEPNALDTDSVKEETIIKPLRLSRSLIKGCAIGLSALVIGSTVGSGRYVGPVDPKKEVGAAFRKALKTKAVIIGSRILAMEQRKGEVISTPDEQGFGEVIRMESFSPGYSWIGINVAMLRDRNGDLDPSTTYSVAIRREACTLDRVCGGRDRRSEDVYLYEGADSDSDYYGWHAYVDETPARAQNLFTAIDTMLPHPRSNLESNEVQQALATARIWGKYAVVLADEALRGDITKPA